MRCGLQRGISAELKFKTKYPIILNKVNTRLLSFHTFHTTKTEIDHEVYLSPVQQYSLQTSDVSGSEAVYICLQNVHTPRDDVA